MTTQNRKVWLIAGSRTPIGSFGKSLRSVTVDTLIGHVMRHAMRRANINPDQVDEVVIGHGFPSGYTPNTGRDAWLKESFPAHVPGMTVSRQCGSGMEAVAVAADRIKLGKDEIVLAGGGESMSTVPFLLPGTSRWDSWQGTLEKRLGIPRMGPRIGAAAKPALFAMIAALLALATMPFVHVLGFIFLAATIVAGGFTVKKLYDEKADNGIAPMSLLKDMNTVYMSGTAQRVADQFGISRAAQDEYALRSQQLARKAVSSGRFDIEIDPIAVPGRGYFSRDEHPRDTSSEKLAKLRGVMGTRDITAGNASGINDGACALILASDEKVAELGVEPLAQIVDSVAVALEPQTMGLGPVLAIQKLLERNNLTLADVDLFELNEAFAAQYLGCEKLLGLDRDRVNVNGGAIALGHPIGMSGARIVLTLAHELKLQGKKRGIAALCVGGGQGVATLIERP